VKDTPEVRVELGAGVKYERIRRILELDPKVFLPCNIKEFEIGTLRKQKFFVHYDGKRWDVLKISSDGIERYVFG